MKKILSLLSLAAILIMAVGCSSDDDNGSGSGTGGTQAEETQKPEWTLSPGRQVENAPVWIPIADELLSSSMTVTIGLDDTFSMTDVGDGDMVAALCDGDCLGCSKVSMTTGNARFYLYVLPPRNTGKDITLAYYNAKTRRVYTWLEAIPYENNKIVGSVKNPYLLKSADDNGGCTDVANIHIDLSDMRNIEWEKDELAVFVGDECRKVITERDAFDKRNVFTFLLPVNSHSERISIHFYSHTDRRIFCSPEYSISADGYCVVSSISWK